MQAAALAIAPLYIAKRLSLQLAFIIFPILTINLVAAAFIGIFPACFVEGTGLTVFKKVSEYVICMVLLLAIYMLYRRKNQLDREIYQLLVASIAITIISELAFTLYIDVYGYFNMVGHLLKIVAFYLIYKAIIESGLRKPYSLLFRNLKLHEEELRNALNEVKALRGILPICAACKKIRDDQGYWQQVEVYIRDRTDADFSHGICPDCMKELYPEYGCPERDRASQS